MLYALMIEIAVFLFSQILEATSNEPWGPHGTIMGDIAHATRNL